MNTVTTLKLVGLLGRSRVGKDTVANILSHELGYPIVRLSTPVKNACCELFDIPRHVFESHAKECIDPRYGKTPRELLVWLTTAMQRDFPPEFFIDRFMATCKDFHVKGIIIPDLRFEHDVNAIRHYGGTIVKITSNKASVLHAHEDPIDALRGDILLENTMTVDDLEKKAASLALHLQ